jgi:hypothetical protein
MGESGPTLFQMPWVGRNEQFEGKAGTALEVTRMLIPGNRTQAESSSFGSQLRRRPVLVNPNKAEMQLEPQRKRTKRLLRSLMESFLRVLG